jgi:hypothetical protein
LSPRFSIIPAGAVTDPRIEARDLQVLCLLGRHIDDLGWCRRSQVRMAKELGCARSTVQGSLDRLIAAEWVQKRPEPRGPQGDTAHSYRVRLDHDENDSFYRDVAKIGTGRKRGNPDGQTENPADSVAPPPRADGSAPPVPPQERHPVPIYGSAPVTTPVKREDSREGAPAHEGRKWDFIAPDETRIAATFEALAQAWEHHAKAGRGSIGPSDKARAAIADLAEAEHEIAIERAPRFLRSLRDANRHPMGIATYVANREFQHHPPPKNADPSLAAPVELKPYVAPLWAMYWKALHKARQATGNDQLRRRLTDCQTWLERGLTTAAALVPSEEETSGLVAVTLDSPEHLAWVAYGIRVNVRIPRPDHVPVIFVPAPWPPELPLSGAQPYRLAMPARIEVRGPVWWWRAFKRIEDGSPFVSQIGKHRIDPLQTARGQAGFTEADYGPLPLPSEIAAMAEVRTLTDAWDQWAMWIEARGGDIALWPDSRIWCPTEYPTLIFGKSEDEKQTGAAA